MSECKVVFDEPDMPKDVSGIIKSIKANETVCGRELFREIGHPAIIEKPGSGIIKSIKANETIYVRSNI